MNIVFDDIIYSIQKAGGVSEVWSQVTLAPLHRAVHIGYANGAENIFFRRNKAHKYEIRPGKCMILQRYLNPKINSEKKFIFHSSYFRTCPNKMAINITTVHDFIYEYYYSSIKLIPHKLQKRNAVMNSDAVICVSENTKRDLEKFYPWYKGMVKVIYNGYKSDVYQYKDGIKKEKLILYVGSRAFYKRFDLAVELMKRLEGYQLVIIGGGELTRQENALLRTLPEGSYKKESYLTDQELAVLYNRALFLCYPSEYEGFGIPPVEAQACGCIPICQRKSSLTEVLNGTGIELDVCNLENTAERIRQCEDGKVLRNMQEEGFKNVKRFSWDKCRKETYDLYDELWGMGK